MKNILVVDGAENCAFSVCRIDHADFAIVFPNPGQDVEFIEDLVGRIGDARTAGVVQRSTTRRIHKRDAIGVHGTLFFGLPDRRKYFPNKREDDVDGPLFVK